MGSRGRTLFVGVALLAPGCGGSDVEDPFGVLPSNTEPPRPSSIAVATVDGSITDVVTVGVLEGFGPNGRTLVELLPPPASYGDFALAGVVVDDPNGTGRIDGRWYPPRIQQSNCSTRIDAAPIPTVAASYVPGRPTEISSGESIGVTEDLFGADETINLTIQLFDEASQRDEILALQNEVYRTGLPENCDLGDTEGLLDFASLPPLNGHPDSTVYEVDQIGFSGIVALVPVGERLAVQVSVGEGIGGGGGATPDRTDLDEVAAHQIARLEAAVLP